jgi:hypothetical protein
MGYDDQDQALARQMLCFQTQMHMHGHGKTALTHQTNTWNIDAVESERERGIYLQLGVFNKSIRMALPVCSGRLLCIRGTRGSRLQLHLSSICAPRRLGVYTRWRIC